MLRLPAGDDQTNQRASKVKEREDECHPGPGNSDEMRDPDDRENEQENIAKEQQDGRGDTARNHDHEVPNRSLRFPRCQLQPGLEELRKGRDERNKVLAQSRVSGGIAERHRPAGHQDS